MPAPQISVGDTVTMDVPDTRWSVRLWCWITNRARPMKREAFKVTHVTTAAGWVSVR